jgi:ABC-type phosphate transport system permease subunit
MTKKTTKAPNRGSEESKLMDITRKKFRLSDFLAEKIIQGVAYLSITIIVLIFIFVFRESLPIFGSAKDTLQSENPVEQAPQETYGEVTDQPWWWRSRKPTVR